MRFLRNKIKTMAHIQPQTSSTTTYRSNKIDYIGWNKLLLSNKNYSWNDTGISGDNTAFAMYAGHAGVVLDLHCRSYKCIQCNSANLYRQQWGLNLITKQEVLIQKEMRLTRREMSVSERRVLDNFDYI